jgi:hypothetical protein
MIFGSNGYEYDGYVYLDNVAHRDATVDGCLDCHLRTTRNFVVGGHSFNMEAEIPTEFEVGPHEDFTVVRNTAGCTDCHGSISDFNVNGAQDETNALMDSLHTILLTANLVDSSGHTISPTTVSADTAGAVWNFLMAEEDQSHGAHNAWYIKGLLESAILYMQGSLPQPTSPGPVRVTLHGDMENPREAR